MKRVFQSMMMNFSTSLDKHTVRKRLFFIRKHISDKRRSQAKENLLDVLYPLLSEYDTILSFCSLPEELDTSVLNALLASEGRLLLPKVEKTELHFFKIDKLNTQLALFSGNLFEPIPQLCRQCPLETIDCVLVPAIGFDGDKYRMGYGKGYYDRLISQAKRSSLKINSIGIGFKEQLIEGALPREIHDQSVDKILLF